VITSMKRRSSYGIWSAIAALVVSGVLAGAPQPCDAQKDFLPAELSDLKLGMDLPFVLDHIGTSGLYAKTPVPGSQRTVVTWFPENNAYYQKLEFWFSEKGRLFMARFGLKDESRWSAAAVKKQFLDKYLGTWLDPKRFRMDPNDMIVYIPQDPTKVQFLEVTNLKSGEKFFELFDKTIDTEDSPMPAAEGVSVTPSKALGQQGSQNQPAGAEPKKEPLPR